MTSIRIVVADDHPLFREGVVRSLGENGMLEVVGEAANADEAVHLTKNLNPDITLLDISMPGGGIEAARQITLLNSDTKTIMLTVSESEDEILGALEAGALGYVLKGIGGPELASVVRQINDGQSYLSPALAARVLLAIKEPPSAGSAEEELIAALTKRETDILKLVSQGKSNKEVGRELDLQEKTVKHYMTRILKKLQARNRVEATIMARDVWKEQ